MVAPFLYVRVFTPPTGAAFLTSIVAGPDDLTSEEPLPASTTTATTTITAAMARSARRGVRVMAQRAFQGRGRARRAAGGGRAGPALPPRLPTGRRRRRRRPAWRTRPAAPPRAPRCPAAGTACRGRRRGSPSR